MWRVLGTAAGDFSQEQPRWVTWIAEKQWEHVHYRNHTLHALGVMIHGEVVFQSYTLTVNVLLMRITMVIACYDIWLALCSARYYRSVRGTAVPDAQIVRSGTARKPRPKWRSLSCLLYVDGFYTCRREEWQSMFLLERERPDQRLWYQRRRRHLNHDQLFFGFCIYSPECTSAASALWAEAELRHLC